MQQQQQSYSKLEGPQQINIADKGTLTATQQ